MTTEQQECSSDSTGLLSRSMRFSLQFHFAGNAPLTDRKQANDATRPPHRDHPNEIAPRVQSFLFKHRARINGLAAVDVGRDVTDAFYLERPTGRIAYSLTGEGPLVICVPGMGDVRSVYRFLAPALATAGFQVATMDLRGHGDSDVTFDSYDDVAAGSDLVALATHLGGPAILIGNSMGAGAACWAAADAPALTAGLVLIGPFVRDRKGDMLGKLMLRLALLRPWGPATWNAYFKKLYPTRRDAEYETHFADVAENLLKPGHWEAFHKTTRTSHDAAEAVLGNVHAPTLIVMGDKDPDFPDPEAEARWIADQLHGKVLMVSGAGHYPQAEFPEVVSPAVVEFVRRITPSAT
jgi:pimeloyl-ACP methyl ester carboxylesterase